MQYNDKGFFGALALSNHDGNGLMFNFLTEQARLMADATKTHKVLYGHTSSFKLEHQALTVDTKRPDGFQPNYMMATINNEYDAPIGFDLPVRNSFVVSSIAAHEQYDLSTPDLETLFGEYLSHDTEGDHCYGNQMEASSSYPEVVRKRVLRDEFDASIAYTGMAAYISPRPTIILVNSAQDQDTGHSSIPLWIGWRSGLPFLMWASSTELLETLFHSVNSNTTNEAIFYMTSPIGMVSNEVLVLNPLYICSKHSKWRQRFQMSGGTLTALGCLRQYLSRIKFSNLGEPTHEN